jgi:hypothetical protein
LPSPRLGSTKRSSVRSGVSTSALPEDWPERPAERTRP